MQDPGRGVPRILAPGRSVNEAGYPPDTERPKPRRAHAPKHHARDHPAQKAASGRAEEQGQQPHLGDRPPTRRRPEQLPHLARRLPYRAPQGGFEESVFGTSEVLGMAARLFQQDEDVP